MNQNEEDLMRKLYDIYNKNSRSYYILYSLSIFTLILYILLIIFKAIYGVGINLIDLLGWGGLMIITILIGISVRKMRMNAEEVHNKYLEINFKWRKKNHLRVF